MSKETLSTEPKKAPSTVPRVNFRRPDLSYIERKESGASKFVGLSAALHIGLIIGLLSMSASFLETPKLEIVTVDLSEKIGPKAIPDGVEDALPSQGTQMASAPAPSLEATPEPLDEPTAPVVATPPPARPKAVVKAAPAPVAKRSAPAVVAKSAPTAPREEVPAQIDDIESPVLVAPPVVPEEQSIDPEEIETAVGKVDEDHGKAVAAAQTQLDDDAKQLDEEQEKQLEAANAQAEQEKAAMAAKAEALRKKNAQAAAAAAALAAQQSAAAQAAKEAREAEGRARAKAANEGDGSGDSGVLAAAPAQGTPGGVRTLEQLRQMPGNPKPTYSEQERLANQSGDAVFLAYIDRSGVPTQLRQTRSTGHANLDQKTIDALKQWKFYPGQEGWVEIPIHWDIKGGPQERSALGQRKVSK